MGGQAVSTLDHNDPGSDPAEGGVHLMTLWHFIAQTLSLSPLHHLDMT